MKKLIGILFVLMLVASLSMISCAKPAPAPAPAPAPTVTVTVTAPALTPAPAPAPQPKPTPTPAPAPAPTKPTVIHWKVFQDIPPGSNWDAYPDVSAEFKKRIEDGTGGRLTLDVLYSGEHPFTAPQILQALKSNAADMVYTSPRAASDEPRIAAARTGLPFLMPKPDFEVDKMVNLKMAEQGVPNSIFGDWNGKWLIYSYFGQCVYIMKDRLITGPDSLKGKKIRVATSDGASLTTMMNGQPVYIDWGEVYTSLATGLVDGVNVSFSGAFGTKLLEQCRYVTWINYGFSACRSVVANKKSFDALPADLQEALMATMKSMTDWYMSGDVLLTLRSLETALYREQITVGPFPNAWREQLRAQAFEKIGKPEIDKAGPKGWEIFDKMAKIIISAGYTVPGYTPK